MNYLAHVLLSGEDPDWQLGGFLGDFVKGPLPAESGEAVGKWRCGVLNGMRLHRRLDAHIEELEHYRAALQVLGPDLRRVGGIALDVFFDYLLVAHWREFSDHDLDAFCRSFYGHCNTHMALFPERAAQLIARAQRHDLFQSYGDRQVYLGVIRRIAERSSFAAKLTAAGNLCLDKSEQLRPLFLAVLPQLQEHAEGFRRDCGA